MLPLWAKEDLEVMAMKGYFAFLKTPPLLDWSLTIRLFRCHILDTHWGGSHPSAEMQLVYSTTPANYAALWMSPYIHDNSCILIYDSNIRTQNYTYTFLGHSYKRYEKQHVVCFRKVKVVGIVILTIKLTF